MLLALASRKGEDLPRGRSAPHSRNLPGEYESSELLAAEEAERMDTAKAVLRLTEQRSGSNESHDDCERGDLLVHWIPPS